MTTRSAHTRSASTTSHHTAPRTSVGRHLRLALLTAGIVVGASACELSIGAESRPAAAPEGVAADPAATGTDAAPGAATPGAATPGAATPGGTGATDSTALPADADRGGQAPAPRATLPAAPAVQPVTPPPAQPPATTAPTATLPPTTLPPTTVPPTTVPPTTVPPTTAPPTTAPPTSQPPHTVPPFTVPTFPLPPLAIVTYRVDVSAVTLALAPECLPIGRSSLSVTGERYVTGHTFETVNTSVGTSPVTLDTASSMTTDALGQGYAGFLTWTVDGFQQRETDFAIGGVGATQIRDHRSITSADGTRSCRADIVYTVTVTEI